MNNGKSYKRILIILGFSVVGFFIAYYLLFRDIRLKNEHISILQSDLSLQTDKQGYLISAEKILHDTAPDIMRINNSIISTDGDVAFIENLESIAHDGGLTIGIDSLSFEDNPKFSSSGITIFKIKAKTDGSWIGTYKFLKQIESLPFKIKIEKFAFTNGINSGSDAGKIGRNNWQSAFEISVLKYK